MPTVANTGPAPNPGVVFTVLRAPNTKKARSGSPSMPAVPARSVVEMNLGQGSKRWMP